MRMLGRIEQKPYPRREKMSAKSDADRTVRGDGPPSLEPMEPFGHGCKQSDPERNHGRHNPDEFGIQRAAQAVKIVMESRLILPQALQAAFKHRHSLVQGVDLPIEHRELLIDLRELLINFVEPVINFVEPVINFVEPVINFIEPLIDSLVESIDFLIEPS